MPLFVGIAGIDADVLRDGIQRDGVWLHPSPLVDRLGTRVDRLNKAAKPRCGFFIWVLLLLFYMCLMVCSYFINQFKHNLN